MYTLHHAAEIRTIDQIDELREVRGKVNPAEMKLARQVIESIEGELNLADYKDEYQEACGDHRRQGCRRGDRGAGRSGAAQGRGSDGSASQEPRSGRARARRRPAKVGRQPEGHDHRREKTKGLLA